MKKKIRDLTLGEAKKICDVRTLGCGDCPLYNVCQYSFGSNDDEDLDQEIEVKEDAEETN